jgi:hypothetical protein
MDNLNEVSSFIGRRLLCIRRVFFTLGDQIERDAGPIELTFAPSGVLLLAVGSDGETLEIREDPWADPFEPPISKENQDWIAEHGKWAAFDVSAEPGYRGLIGTTLNSIKVLRAPGGNPCGLRLAFDSQVLDFVGSGDEALVFLTQQDDLMLAAMKVYVGEELSRKE